MAVDFKTEQVISMAQASAMLPGHPSLCTLWRWRLKGIRGRKLECVVIGGTPYTSIEALERFAQQQGESGATRTRTSRQRQRDVALAEQNLESGSVKS